MGERSLRMLLGIPPMGEESLAVDFAAAIAALRSRGKRGFIHGAPSDEDHARSLEQLRDRLLTALAAEDADG